MMSGALGGGYRDRRDPQPSHGASSDNDDFYSIDEDNQLQEQNEDGDRYSTIY